jgi:uncharacterized membrane protein YtjA (UPF0391 family)
MLTWALAFLLVAIGAALFGFSGIASTATSIAKVIFFLFLIAFAVSLVLGIVSNRRTRSGDRR